jgi:hypothetical protein
MTLRLCKTCHDWHDLSEPWPIECRAVEQDKRSKLSGPAFISDNVEVKSMADGQIYTSKRALRRSYRERGYVEVGDQQQKIPPRVKPDRKEIRNSLRKGFSQAGIPV